MIVTIEQERKFLIKKNCWLLETDQQGDYKMVNTAIHWKEGMEVFETMEDCLNELNRRKESRMAEGKCPRCHYRSLLTTVHDITHLSFLQNAKDGKLYGCDSCKTIWYKDSNPISLAYDASYENQIVEWAGRNLKPTQAIESVLINIGDISTSKNEMEFPAHVKFKSGLELTHCLINLSNRPPHPDLFKKKDWYYLDEVQEVKPSAFSYPYEIAKYIKSNQNSIVDIKTKHGTNIIRFNAHAGVFMPSEYADQDGEFELVNSKTRSDLKNIINIYEVADRGGPDIWSVNPPVKPTFIFGEF